MSPDRPRAAIFDMDRTVLQCDSSMSWVRYLRRRGELPLGFVLKTLLWAGLYELALLDIDTVADRVAANLEGDLESEMREKSAAWYREELERHVAPRAVEAVERHRARGDVLVLLTGGGQFAARHVAGTLDIDHVLCTELETHEGRFTGRIAQRCFGPHKVEVAERWAQSHDVELRDAVFYSDSYNDLPMLTRVGSPVAVNPDVRLRRHAERHGWLVEPWR